MDSIDAILLAQRQLYRRKLEDVIPRHKRTIAIFLVLMEFFMERDRYSMSELRDKFVEVDGKSMSLPGFKKHIDLLVKHGLLSRPHYRAIEFNIVN